MIESYYYFSSSMSFFKIADSFSHLAERVTSIYDGHNGSGFEEIFQKNQVLLDYTRGTETALPAPDP